VGLTPPPLGLTPPPWAWPRPLEKATPPNGRETSMIDAEKHLIGPSYQPRPLWA